MAMAGWIYLLALLLCRPSGAGELPGGIRVSEDDERIRIVSSALEASIRKKGYVSGVEGGSFLDRKTGFRDLGFGLDIVDWLLEPGSDAEYRDRLRKDLVYEYNNPFHGKIAKRSVEGPQICTRARSLEPAIIRGRDFVAVKMSYRYHLAAPGKKAGSRWEQTILFPAGKRYFISCDRIRSANDSECLFLRIDMPGHLKHRSGDSFSEIYLSYLGRISSGEFASDFPPDRRFLYAGKNGKNGKDVLDPPRRFIRAYRIRDPETGRQGPWLAGMTLDPSMVHEAWCHQRGYVCFIQEIGGKRIRAGDSFSAAFIVGYFDTIEEMHRIYDEHAGANLLEVDSGGWRLRRP